MDNLKALKKQLKEDIITYDCIDYIDEDGKLVEYVEVTMVDKIIDVPMSLKEVNIGLLVNRIIELGLYLDTHPDDKKALCLHRKYCKEYRELTDKYQKVYGPLTIQFPCNKWRWLEEPWPGEGGIV